MIACFQSSEEYMHILILQADCSIDAIGTHTCGALMSSPACAHPSVFVTVDSRHGQLTNNCPHDRGHRLMPSFQRSAQQMVLACSVIMIYQRILGISGIVAK